jgi:hypothetical protein
MNNPIDSLVMPEIGDYCLATKYGDGDPGDHWGLGFYDGERDGRHYIKDSGGNQIRASGFRRVGKVNAEVGRWLLNTAARALEESPPGTVNLWTMLTPLAFDVDEA